MLGKKKEKKKKKTEESVAEPERAKPAAAAAAAAADAIINAMVDPVMVLDIDGNLTSINPAYEKTFGYKREESVGKHMLELPGIKFVKPEYIEKFMPLLAETIEKGSAAPVEFVFPRKDGRMISVSLATGVIKDVQGNPTHVVAVLRDITELKRAEEERIKAMKLASNIIDGMIDVVGFSDMEGRITRINEAVEFWGYKQEELIGKPVIEVLAKCSLPKVEEERKKTLETGVMRNLELIGLKKDGSEFPVLVNVTLMRGAEGKPTGRIFSLRDITDLKRLQEKEKAATAENARAEEAEKYSKELEKKSETLRHSRR